jgi:hypothetical protein
MSENAAMTPEELSLAKNILGPWVCLVDWHTHDYDIDDLSFICS